MIDAIKQYDEQLLIFLNNLGNEHWDWLWLLITNQFNMVPVFALVAFLTFKQYGLKNLLITILIIIVLITFTDQLTNLVKNTTQRLRPCHEPHLQTLIRIVKQGGLYSYFSGHAANSMAFAMFFFLLLKPFYKKISFIFLFPLIFAYSRIYLGLHYPLDIVTGYIVGSINGYLAFKAIQIFFKKFNKLKNI